MSKYQKYKLIILSCFLSLVLIIMHNYSLNGKYIAHDYNGSLIIDSRSGKIYYYGDMTFWSLSKILCF